MGTEMELFFAVVSIISGMYCMYGFCQAKIRGVIVESLYLDKETAQKKCINKKAYLKCISIPTFILGIGLVIYGGITLYHAFVTPCYWMMQGSLIVLLAVLVWFGIKTTKAKNRYFK